jgi:hypothetical protein
MHNPVETKNPTPCFGILITEDVGGWMIQFAIVIEDDGSNALC